MSVRLHPEKGVNPRMTCCYKCGKDVGIILLGTSESIYQCGSCGMKHIGYSKECNKCKGSLENIGKIGEFEKVPCELCDECKDMEEQMATAVAEGGIYWRCKACGSDGALKKESELAKATREHCDIQPPEPCGFEFDEKYRCPVCKGKEIKECDEKPDSEH